MPTDALPGSPMKLAAIAGRVALGLSPWHPGDAGGAALPGSEPAVRSDRKTVGRSPRDAPMPRGVRKRFGRYEARVKVRGKAISLGTFATAFEAVAYRTAWIAAVKAGLPPPKRPAERGT